VKPRAPQHAETGPALAADAIIEVGGGIVLIERRFEPPGWAIPGGFVEVGETVEKAAVREAKEETGLDIDLRALLGVYSDPARDARRHVVSVVFVASAEGMPVGADDAARAVVVDPSDPPAPLAFDHARILSDYVAFRRTGRTPSPDER